jgi:hypothetical protein
MPVARSRVLLIVAAAALMLASTARAQSPQQFCDVTVANAPANTDPLHPSAVYAGFEGQIGRNEWGQIARTIEGDFRQSAAPIPAQDRDSFTRQLQAFAAEMTAIEQSPSVADIVARAQKANQIRFTVGTDPVNGGYVIFNGTPDRITIAANAPDAVAKDLCYRAHAAQKVLVRFGQSGRQRVVNALGHYVTLWDNYNSKGYSQYPWELYLNGLWSVRTGTFTPPASQWVVAHPAVAVEVAWPRSQDMRRLDIITFEPIGYLRYREDRTSYGGLSLLVTLSASADPGYGVLGHIGRIGKVGWVYHPRQEDGSRHGAVFSVDLYKIIGGVPQKLQDAKARVEALRDDALRAIP